jgi:hypothetical protein
LFLPNKIKKSNNTKQRIFDVEYSICHIDLKLQIEGSEKVLFNINTDRSTYVLLYEDMIQKGFEDTISSKVMSICHLNRK